MRLIDRRSFLQSAGLAFVAGLGLRAREAFARSDAVFGAACQKPDGRFGCAVFSADGRILSMVDLPDRGHDVTVDAATGRAVAFARRPQTFAVVFDPRSGCTAQTITSSAGRHFFGHGFFSPDGKLLYATENEIESAAGMIGVYDATAGFTRIGEYPTHGMDPHEALLMPDGETIVVANGGIETYPAYGRQKLNIATMEPSLVFIDRRTGTLIEQHRLDPSLHQLSIRHLAVDGRNRVWFGCQYEGAPENRPPLVGSAAVGEPMTLAAFEPDALASLSNYVGSVAASGDGARIALASPVGNTILTLDAASGRVISRDTLKNGCGLAPSGTGFLATSGEGAIASLPPSRSPRTAEGLLWDNHILAFDLA